MGFYFINAKLSSSTVSALLFSQGCFPLHVFLRPSSRSRRRLELRLTLWALFAVRIRGVSCLIGIVGDVILLYNNEEKETSAGHENKTKEVKRKRLTTQFIATVFTQTHHHETVLERFGKPMCFNDSSIGGQGWGETGSHDSPVCWMMLPLNQAGMVVLTRRALANLDS